MPACPGARTSCSSRQRHALHAHRVRAPSGPPVWASRGAGPRHSSSLSRARCQACVSTGVDTPVDTQPPMQSLWESQSQHRPRLPGRLLRPLLGRGLCPGVPWAPLCSLVAPLVVWTEKHRPPQARPSSYLCHYERDYSRPSEGEGEGEREREGEKERGREGERGGEEERGREGEGPSVTESMSSKRRRVPIGIQRGLRATAEA